MCQLSAVVSLGAQCVLLLHLMLCARCQEFEPKSYCEPGQPCWPSPDTFHQLETDNPTLEVVLRGDKGWDKASDLVLNRRVTKSIGAAVYATTTDDVIRVVEFTQKHNISLKVISSGHEFIGRNTGEGALQLSVAKMDSITSDLDCTEHHAGCITVEPGVWFAQAYKAVDSVNRIILGGAEPSVSVTGWALGGGHSPVSPKTGLGTDQILELKMVLGNLSLVTLTKDGTSIMSNEGNKTVTVSDNTDLFWAVRGGGGGTFGIVTSIKYKLHMPPSKYTVMSCAFGAGALPAEAMKKIKKTLQPIIMNLPNEFGGYLLTGALCYKQTPCLMAVYATYIFTHWGAVRENQASFDKLEQVISSLKPYQTTGPCKTVEYNTFYDYMKVQPNVTYQTVDMDGTFLSPAEYNDDFIDREAEIYADAFDSQKTFLTTWIRLGGQTKDTSSGATAVNPVFRNAMWTIAYGGDEVTTKAFKGLVADTVTTKGQYYSECDDDLAPGVWQKEFWGDSYSRLLKIKRQFDSENQFTCKQCVGSTGSAIFASVTVLLTVSVGQILSTT